MAKPTPPLPPSADLVRIIQASVANADALADDAALLLDHGRAARAHSLAVLAVEEMGKACLCIVATVPPPDFAKEFWDTYRDHPGKLRYAHGMLQVLLGDGDAPVAEQFATVAMTVASDSATKLSGFYVDYRDQAVQTPDDAVTEDDSRTALLAARTLVNELGTRWTHPDVLDRLEAAQASLEFTDALDTARAAMDQDPDAALATTRAFYRDPLGLNPGSTATH